MTLIESLLLLAILGGAIGGASVAILGDMGPLLVVCAALAGGLGVPVVLGAVLAGGLGVMVVLGAVVYVLSAIESEFIGRPYWPACTACGAVHFKLEPSPGPTIMRCGCGRRYVRHGRQCRHALPGGASRPHLRWRAFRGWIDDDDASFPAPAHPPYRGSADD